MPTVIAHHDVRDTDHCLASPKREEVFGPLGVTNIRTFVSPDDPKKVAVLMDIADMDAVMDHVQTQDAADAMAHAAPQPTSVRAPGSWPKRRALLYASAREMPALQSEVYRDRHRRA